MDLKPVIPRNLGLGLIAYGGVAAVVWGVRAGMSAPALWAIWLHVLVAGGLAVATFGWGQGRQTAAGPVVAWWAAPIPWILWLLSWSEIGWLYTVAPPGYHDALVGRLDLAVFGAHLHITLPARLAGPWWGEGLTAVYLSYYGLVLGPPLVHALRGRAAAFWRHSAGLILTYLGAFTIYLLWPVNGPRDVDPASGLAGAREAGGILTAAMEALFRAGDSQGTAFPSSHCAGAVAAALLCRGCFGRRTERLITIWALLIVVSTIHTQNHYAIDSLAGCGLALAFYAASRLQPGHWPVRPVDGELLEVRHE